MKYKNNKNLAPPLATGLAEIRFSIILRTIYYWVNS